MNKQKIDIFMMINSIKKCSGFPVFRYYFITPHDNLDCIFIYSSHVQDVIEGGRMRKLTRSVNSTYNKLKTWFGVDGALTYLHECKLEPYMEGDGIPAELFQILVDDAVKVLHSICQQIWKTQQWPQDWKRSVFIPIPKKGNAKESSNYHTIAPISHASKVMLKILQARLQ